LIRARVGLTAGIYETRLRAESAHLWVVGVVSVKGLVKAKGGFEVRAAGSGTADDEAVVKGLKVVGRKGSWRARRYRNRSRTFPLC